MDLTSSVAWRYHQATNHSPDSIRRNRHVLDWTNQPRPYKRYADPLPAVPLPDDLAPLLRLSAGVTKRLSVAGGTMAFRAAACTGALYHIDLYVVDGQGVYHYDPEHDVLRQLRQGDFRGALGSGAPVSLVASSTWWRNAWKYQERTYRHAFWDSGTILANVLCLAAERGLPAAVRLSFDDARVNALLDLDPAREAALAVVPLGEPAAAPPAAEVRRLGLATQPYSFSEVDYPLIREVHAATSEPAALPELTVEPVAGPLEDVIRRRGSARRFERSPISLEALRAILSGPAYLIVNAVDGLEPGTYFFNGAEFQTLRLGDPREAARFLDLGQDLGGDAAVNVYLLADLADAIGRYGERGYRWASMEAGLRAGRMYLAAYAAGVAATGLTFFDDDVVDFFSPQAAGQSVLFLLALGNRLEARPTSRASAPAHTDARQGR